MYGNNDWLDYLAHSKKGSTWKNHKYIEKIGNQYVYPEDKEIENLRKSQNHYRKIKNMYLDEAKSGGNESAQSTADVAMGKMIEIEGKINDLNYKKSRRSTASKAKLYAKATVKHISSEARNAGKKNYRLAI